MTERILVVAPSWVGDAILSGPVIALLRQRRTGLAILLIALSFSFVVNMAVVTVSRTALVNRLRANNSVPVVSVAAPAGYGKTTLMAQWAARDHRPFAWVSIDARDEDLVPILAKRVLHAVEVGERTNVVEPGEPVREHDRIRLVYRRRRRRRAGPIGGAARDVAVAPGGRIGRNCVSAAAGSGHDETCANEVCQHTFHGGSTSGPTYEVS